MTCHASWACCEVFDALCALGRWQLRRSSENGRGKQSGCQRVAAAHIQGISCLRKSWASHTPKATQRISPELWHTPAVPLCLVLRWAESGKCWEDRVSTQHMLQACPHACDDGVVTSSQSVDSVRRSRCESICMSSDGCSTNADVTGSVGAYSRGACRCS
jgi:hypothetical protein